MKILTVLRSGGEYRPEHVERLRGQCAKWAPGVPFECLSDLDGTLRHDWPGWWCKLAMFEDVREPFLFMDLDTTICGPLDDLLARRELTVLSDFYWPEKIASGLMLVTPNEAEQAWAAFTADPDRHMRECRTQARWGDQGFLESVWGRSVSRWQRALPDSVVSYKRHVRRAQTPRESGNGSVPEGASVVCFHGKPRPWEVGF